MNGDGDKALDLLEKDIDGLLENKDAEIDELIRGILRAQRAILPFLQQQQDDHKKTVAMYSAFTYGKWAVLIILALAIGDITTRIIAAAAAIR